MSAEREPASREESGFGYYVLACGFIGALGGAGEMWALVARHFMTLPGAVPAGLFGPFIGLMVGTFSFTAGGRRQ